MVTLGEDFAGRIGVCQVDEKSGGVPGKGTHTYQGSTHDQHANARDRSCSVLLDPRVARNGAQAMGPALHALLDAQA